MKTYHTTDLWKILGGAGFAGADINLYSSREWMFPTYESVFERDGFLESHFKHRVAEGMLYDGNKYNCVNAAFDLYNLAHKYHHMSTGTSARLALGWMVYTPDERKGTGRPRVDSMVNTLVSLDHCINWVITIQHDAPILHTIEPQMSKRFDVNNSEIQSTKEMFA